MEQNQPQMDYDFEITYDVFNSLLEKDPQKNLTFNTLNEVDFNIGHNFINFAFFLFCCEKVVTLKHRGFQTVLQFFILSAHKKFKYKKPNHDGETTALKYAVKSFVRDSVYTGVMLSDKEKSRILETIKQTKYKKEDLINFYRRIEILSHWAIDNPLRIHEDLVKEAKDKVKEAQQNLQNSITNFVKETIMPDALKGNIFSNLSFSLSNPFQQKNPLEELLKGMSYKEYYLSFMTDQKIQKKDKYKKMVEFFLILMKEKTKDFNMEDDLKSIVDYHFEERFRFRSIEIVHDTEKLIEEYIPKWIDFVSLLGTSSNTKEINESLKVLDTYSKKINNYYLEEIKREISIFKNFLEEKVNKGNF
jgi:hypothetical protein